MAAPTPDDDPGWGRVGPRLLLFFLPGYARRVMTGRLGSAEDPLVLLRHVWLSFSIAILLFGVVVAFGAAGVETGAAGPWAIVVLVAGVIGLALTRWAGTRRLKCDDPAQLAGSYRTRFFLRVAFSQAIALLGFVASFITGHWWLYWIGAPFTLIGFGLNAPTRAHLAADQLALDTEGCPHRLVPALRLPINP